MTKPPKLTLIDLEAERLARSPYREEPVAVLRDFLDQVEAGKVKPAKLMVVFLDADDGEVDYRLSDMSVITAAGMAALFQARIYADNVPDEDD